MHLRKAQADRAKQIRRCQAQIDRWKRELDRLMKEPVPGYEFKDNQGTRR